MGEVLDQFDWISPRLTARIQDPWQAVDLRNLFAPRYRLTGAEVVRDFAVNDSPVLRRAFQSLPAELD